MKKEGEQDPGRKRSGGSTDDQPAQAHDPAPGRRTGGNDSRDPQPQPGHSAEDGKSERCVLVIGGVLRVAAGLHRTYPHRL